MQKSGSVPLRYGRVIALQQGEQTDVSSGSQRDQNGRHNKGSPEVCYYLETCREEA